MQKEKAKIINQRLLLSCFSLCLCVPVVKNPAQTGGTYDLSHNIIAAGGSSSLGGAFRLDGTSGQPIAGTLSVASGVNARGGFWAFDQLAPTAAMVGVSGHVRTANGAGIRSVIVTLTSASGHLRTAQTGSFGIFRFDEVEAGQTYVISVTSRRYFFSEPTRLIDVNDNIADADFTAES